MNDRLRTLLSPLNFAGYLAWGAIGFEMLVARGSSAPGENLLVAGLHLAFLALFMAVTSGQRASNAARAMVLAQVGLAFVLMTLTRYTSVPILLILCVVQLVRVFSARQSVVLIVLMNVVVYFIYREIWELRSPIISTLMHMSFQGFASLTAWFAFRAESARDELAATNADLLATRSLLAESARDSERLRLSRELHDVAGHKLTALKLNLAALQRDPRHGGDEQVALCARLADELLADIRGVVAQMRRDDGLDLEQALQALATPFPRPRMHLEIAPEARVASLGQAEAVLRAVQEGLTNAVRHSQANHLWVVLRRDGGELRLDIRDDGRGGGELRAGSGLCGMRERLEAEGGGLSVQRTDTGGVHLQAWLPALA
jgi:signal transduction histidine kinase